MTKLIKLFLTMLLLTTATFAKDSSSDKVQKAQIVKKLVTKYAMKHEAHEMAYGDVRKSNDNIEYIEIEDGEMLVLSTIYIDRVIQADSTYRVIYTVLLKDKR